MAERQLDITISSKSRIDSAECTIESIDITLNPNPGSTEWTGSADIDVVRDLDYEANVVIQGATKWDLVIKENGEKDALIDRSKVAPEGNSITDQMSSEDPEAMPKGKGEEPKPTDEGPSDGKDSDANSAGGKK